MQIHQLFPLAVAQEKLTINETERAEMSQFIYDNQNKSQPQAQQNSFAWTGDTNASEFLFSEPLFQNLAKQIGDSIKSYLAGMSINVELLDFYFQRSWATVSYQNQNIALHDHAQSNISFAFFLKKPANSGGTLFQCNDLPNEIAKDIFNQDKYNLGLIKQTNAFNAKHALIDAEQDTLLIFPSKALHSTTQNLSAEPRISIAGDVTIMLKESGKFEHIMPNFKYWTPFHN